MSDWGFRNFVLEAKVLEPLDTHAQVMKHSCPLLFGDDKNLLSMLTLRSNYLHDSGHIKMRFAGTLVVP